MPQIMSIPGQIPAGNRLKREFYLINQIPPGHDGERQDMNKILKFSWHSSQICSIEPAFGCVPPGQSFPLQLCIEAEQSGNINEKLICDIENGSPLEFEVNAIINEPKVRVPNPASKFLWYFPVAALNVSVVAANFSGQITES